MMAARSLKVLPWLHGVRITSYNSISNLISKRLVELVHAHVWILSWELEPLMSVRKFLLYCFAFQYPVTFLNKYIESVSVLRSIFSWLFALYGKWENEVNKCDNERLLSISEIITTRKEFAMINSVIFE